MDLHEIVSQIKLVANDLGKTPTIVEFIVNSKVSKRQINKHGWNNLINMAGLEPNQNSQQKDSVKIQGREPRIFIFDLELSPIIAHVWQLFDVNVGLNQIVSDWHILSWAGKWLDGDEMFYFDQRDAKDLSDDKEICQKLRDMIASADAFLGQNSDAFDIKKLNARLIKHNIDPLPDMIQLDTLKIAKKYFKFTSNKLEYLAKFLGCSEKLVDRKFNGHSLWVECLKGNVDAFNEMEAYNKQDVLVTEEVYNKLKKYDSRNNFQMVKQDYSCDCGSIEFKKDGLRYTKTGAYQRYICTACGKYNTGKENLIDSKLRKTFFK